MVDNELFRNGSGYVDITAYEAMKNYESEKSEMELYNGDIFRGRLNNGGERYFVILSVHDRYCTVLMLSDNENLPFSIKCEGMKYTDPGQLQYMFNDNLLDFVRAMTQPEYDDLMKAVIDSLGYELPTKEVVKEVEVIKEVPVAANVPKPTNNSTELMITQLKTEAKVYKELYESLLAKVMG